MGPDASSDATRRAPWAPPQPPRRSRMWVVPAAIGVFVLVLSGTQAVRILRDHPSLTAEPRRTRLDYRQFLAVARANEVERVRYDEDTGIIKGTFAIGHTEDGRSHFVVQGPAGMLPTEDVVVLAQHGVGFDEPTGEVEWVRLPRFVTALFFVFSIFPFLQLIGIVVVIVAIVRQQRRRA